MSDKKEETYNNIFNVLLTLEPGLNPTDIMVDFEMAAINASKRNFPLADVHGCHFHFTQNVWKHIQSVGLQTIYNEDEDFALQLRLLTALAFVPVGSVDDAYDELVSTEFFTAESEHKEAIELLLTYFQKTYVYGFDRFGKKKPPLIPIVLWNVYENTLSGKSTKIKSK